MKQILLYKTRMGNFESGIVHAAMQLKKLIYALVLTGLLVSCDRDELLNFAPYGVTTPETTADFRLLMNQKSGMFGSGTSGWASSYSIDRVLTDDIKVPDGFATEYLSTYKSRFYGALTWSESIGLLEENDEDWGGLYNNIQTAHLIIEKVVDPNVSGREDEKQQIVAECKVQRAYAYFSLVNLYSKQYDAATAKDDLGVPIRTNSTMSGPTPRQSVQAVYDVILQDLKEAIESESLEKSHTEMNWQVTEAAAYGLRARVNLQMGNFADALSDASKTLELYKKPILDLSTISVYPFNYDNEEIILLKEYRTNMPENSVYAADELIALYEANDLRLEWRFEEDIVIGGYEFVFQPGRYQPRLCYTGISVPEMYLIRAECIARLDGDLTQAISDLNTLRVNRYATGTYVDLTSAELPDAPTTLAFVKEERRRELADRGMRWFDLKRYNAYDKANITIIRIIDGEVVTLEPNSNGWIVPLVPKVSKWL